MKVYLKFNKKNLFDIKFIINYLKFYGQDHRYNYADVASVTGAAVVWGLVGLPVGRVGRVPGVPVLPSRRDNSRSTPSSMRLSLVSSAATTAGKVALWSSAATTLNSVFKRSNSSTSRGRVALTFATSSSMRVSSCLAFASNSSLVGAALTRGYRNVRKSCFSILRKAYRRPERSNRKVRSISFLLKAFKIL